MIQQINLYHPDGKKYGSHFGFEQMLFVMAGFISILGLVSVYESYLYYKNKAEIKQLTQQQADKNEKLQSISSKVPTEKTRNQIIEDISKFNTKISDKKRILSRLRVSIEAGSIGYSNYFEALARRPVEGLWLTDIIIKDSGQYLLLEGRTLSPDNIPKLINVLSSEKIFSGKTFELFKMTLDEKTRELNFYMETKSESDA